MNIKVPKKAAKIISVFQKEGLHIYLVGGAVRDIMMGKLVYDWDFTTNATPQKMLKLFEEAYYTNDFGTVGIPPENQGERPFEITTFRSEFGYSDSRRPDKVVWGKNLEEDLKRRDFTINALALKFNEKIKPKDTKSKLTPVSIDCDLIDLYQGKKDIEAKLIRAVGNPNERFSEDALRMMRAIRIAAELGFSIEETTYEAIQKNASLINKISKERIKDEIFKTLASNYPYEGMLLFKNLGLMRRIIPEMENTFGVEQKSPGRHHIYDVGTHSMLSLKFVAKRNTDPLVRFATMIHDIGKPPTYKKLKSGVITFYNHETVGAAMAKKIADRLRFSRTQKERLYKLVRWHQFSVDEKQTDSAIRRFIRRVGLENVEDVLDLRIGDRLGGGARETSWRLEEFKKRLIEVQKQPFSVSDLKIDGHDVMKILNLEPGPSVGKILNSIFEEVLENKIENKREILLKELKKHK